MDIFVFFNDISIYHSLVNQYRPRSFSGKPWVFPHVKWANRWANGLRCSLLIIIWVECAPYIFCSLNNLQFFNMNYMYMLIHVVVFSKRLFHKWMASEVSYFTSPKDPHQILSDLQRQCQPRLTWRLEHWLATCFLDLSSHFPWFAMIYQWFTHQIIIWISSYFLFTLW